MDNQIQLKKELKILGFLIEMRKCYLEGKHKKNRYILARKYKVGNVPMSIIEKQIKNEITEKSVDDFIKECREYRNEQERIRKTLQTQSQPSIFDQNNEDKANLMTLLHAADYVYNAWMGGTMQEVRYGMDDLGKVINFIKVSLKVED